MNVNPIFFQEGNKLWMLTTTTCKVTGKPIYVTLEKRLEKLSDDNKITGIYDCYKLECSNCNKLNK